MRRIYTVLAALSTIASAIAQVPTNGLVQHWEFNSSLSTSVNGGSDLQYINTAQYGTDRFGNANGALKFLSLGTNTVPTVTASNLPQGNSARSISFWYRGGTQVGARVLVYGSAAQLNAFGVEYEGSIGEYLNCYVWGANYNTTYTNMTRDITQWNNCVVTYDGDTIKLYENGALVRSNSIAINTAGNTLRLFQYPDSSYTNFDTSYIDDVLIYDRELQDAEITALVQTGGLCNYTAYYTDIVNANQGSCDGEVVLHLAPLSAANNTFSIQVLPGSTQFAGPNPNEIRNADSIVPLNDMCAGTYNLRIVEVDANFTEFGCADTVTFTIGNASATCQYDFAFVAIPENTIGGCTGKVSFEYTVTVGGQSVAFAGGLQLTTVSGPSTLAANNYRGDTIPNLCAGNYNVLFTPTDKNGTPLPGCEFPVSFTIGGVSTGINDVAAAPKVSLYPNPCNSILTVSGEETIKSISIVTLLGQVLQTVAGESNTQQISIEHLDAGIYLTKVTTLNGTATTPFIKQ